MLTEEQTVDKLRQMAEDFESAVDHKDYMRAKALYNKSLVIATFMQLGKNVMIELFGQNTASDEDVTPDGLFRRAEVRKVDLECCIKRNKAYEDQACQKSGTSVQYYSDENFCARCKKKSLAG